MKTLYTIEDVTVVEIDGDKFIVEGSTEFLNPFNETEQKRCNLVGDVVIPLKKQPVMIDMESCEMGLFDGKAYPVLTQDCILYHKHFDRLCYFVRITKKELRAYKKHNDFVKTMDLGGTIIAVSRTPIVKPA